MYYIVLNISFNKGLIMQASSHTHQSIHRSYSFEFSNSNSSTVLSNIQSQKLENTLHCMTGYIREIRNWVEHLFQVWIQDLVKGVPASEAKHC